MMDSGAGTGRVGFCTAVGLFSRMPAGAGAPSAFGELLLSPEDSSVAARLSVFCSGFLCQRASAPFCPILAAFFLVNLPMALLGDYDSLRISASSVMSSGERHGLLGLVPF